MDQTGVGGSADPETLRMIHTYKTGALIKSSARIGAILAGAGEEEQAAVSEYAMELGLCFQIVDDVLNATSTREALGKSAGSDAEQGKATFVEVYGLDGAKREGRTRQSIWHCRPSLQCGATGASNECHIRPPPGPFSGSLEWREGSRDPACHGCSIRGETPR
jgi:geranylgeranyl pyrophosphate synthase